MNIISDNQLYEGCLAAAKSPAYLDTLLPYEKQALEQYAKEQQNTKFFSDELRNYYRALPNNIYAAADKVLALLAPPIEVMADTPSDKLIGVPNSLSLRQLALICQYNGTLVSKGEVANALAESIGYTSGERLYKHYNNLRCPTDRVGVEGKEVGPRIRDIEAALPHLTGLHLQQAKNELDTIKPRK
jgi:hypothetical protein